LDLRLYFRVLWRFRVIVAAGFLLACVLTFFSVARVSFTGGSPTVSYRQAETWKATVLFFVTEKGFPYGYTVLPYNPPTTSGGATGGSGAATSSPVPRFATPGTFSGLAVYYAPFVQSDAFQAMLRKRTHIRGVVAAQAVVDIHLLPQPYVDLFAYAAKPGDAVRLANTASSVFQQYVLRQEVANRIPVGKRVELEVLSQAHQAAIYSPRKKTLPIVIFLTVMLAAVGLAFVLENLRPRVRTVGSSEDEAQQNVAARRTA
jgi:hypothetical protein